jgi:hypothetical protein
MRTKAREAGPGAEREPPASLRPLYDARRARSVAAVRAAVAALAAAGHRVTLAAIEQASRGLPEGAVSAKTVLRNVECRALYDAAAAGRPGVVRSSRSGSRALRAELAAVAGTGDEDGAAPAAPSAAEVRRARLLDRRSKRDLAAMVIRLEREVGALHRHNANLRDRLLRDSLGHGGQVETEAVPTELPIQCS